MPEFPADAGPREIVAVLHREIAAQSPERAVLVAEYEALPAKPGYPLRTPRLPSGGRSSARLERLEVYTALRLSGTGQKAAATRAGISHHTGRQYEADFLATLGGAL